MNDEITITMPTKNAAKFAAMWLVLRPQLPMIEGWQHVKESADVIGGMAETLSRAIIASR